VLEVLNNLVVDIYLKRAGVDRFVPCMFCWQWLQSFLHNGASISGSILLWDNRSIIFDCHGWRIVTVHGWMVTIHSFLAREHGAHVNLHE
jgi:hypothetical protein